MIVSASLASIPFISSTDATRLQMAAKQLAQTVTHLNCKRPYVIGSSWYHLTNTTRLYRSQAKSDGAIIYSNNELMIVIFDETEELKIYEVPEYLHTSYSFATRIRYKREVGSFKKGEILYEYDCFTDGVPSYGYNVNTAFFPFFGVNFEDCVVISEYLGSKLKSQKIQKVLIPIYTYSLFKSIYTDSKHGFIPEIHQKINQNVIAISASPKGSNAKSTLRSFNLYDFSSVINSSINFNSTPIVSKLYNSKVQNIKVHVIGKNTNLIDKNLQAKVEGMRDEYHTYIRSVAKDIGPLLGQEYTGKIFKNHYIVNNPKNDLQSITSLDDLAYVLEIDLIKEEGITIGDKISNRYAGKGVVGLVLPDELRPYNSHTKEPIDLILGPLSVYSRMNFGAVIEGLISKTVNHCEKEILSHSNANFTFETLNRLAEVSKILNNSKYADEIHSLSYLLKENSSIFHEFLHSISNGGMYFEAPDFCTANIHELQQYIKSTFDISTNDSITLKKELFPYIKEKLKLDIEVPTTDVIYPNIYNSPLYILKLKQLSANKFAIRDLGGYSTASKQPVKDMYGQNKGSHLGSMEFDALIAHNNINSIKEFHTVKSDCIDLKNNLIAQLIDSGQYELPTYKSKSYTKMIIDSLMTFLNKN